MIELFLKQKKVTVKQIQRLTGFLNFLCRAIIPGRAFTRRLYAYVFSSMKPHHHIKVNQEIKSDLSMWKQFLDTPDVYSRPFMEFVTLDVDDINMYSDASKSLIHGGLGAICDSDCMMTPWDYLFIEEQDISIEYLELYAVTVAVLALIHKFKNKKIYLFCDNMSVVHMINNSSSTCRNCMVLIRWITLWGLKYNVRVFTKFVPKKSNGLADSLSRLDLKRLWRHAPKYMNITQTAVPREIWPMHNVWLK